MNKKAGLQFAVCVKNEGYNASLEPRKIYQIVQDDEAAKDHFIRIIDESGEDYLYPSDFFLTIQLPQPVEKAISLVI